MRATPITLALLLLAACGDDEAPATTPTAPAAEEPEAPEPTPAASGDEACAQVIVVAWQGATAAAPTITRTEADARAKAENLRERLDAGEDFATLARAESDASSSGPRGGLLGTYARDEWPPAHEPIANAVFGLAVGQTTDVVSAPYGYVIARRCAVEKVHTRHILIRYAGARNAGEDITRTRVEARQLADRLRAQATSSDHDFAELARQHSEDGSAERGGDLGSLGRGRLQPAYEDAAFALTPGQVSGVVETEFGFHIIQRMPEPR